jgi:adenosylcobinamide-GDP ribazoletransferase
MAHVGDAAGSKSKPLAEQISRAALWTGFLWCFMAVAIAAYAAAAIKMVAFSDSPAAVAQALAGGLAGSALAFAFMRRLLRQRLQGFTGDALGATQQLCEIAFYLGLALAL